MGVLKNYSKLSQNLVRRRKRKKKEEEEEEEEEEKEKKSRSFRPDIKDQNNDLESIILS